MTDGSYRESLSDRIDAIESAYEFFLAYAAQGRRTDRDSSKAHSSVREHLGNMNAALEDIAGVAKLCASEKDPALADVGAAFFDAIEDDSTKARAVVELLLAQSDISSQLIDNFNASIHVRALLTDLFVVDEALKGKRE